MAKVGTIEGRMRVAVVVDDADTRMCFRDVTNETLFVYDGNLVFQERDQNDMTLTTYTRGTDLSGTLQGAGGIGGLLARSDKMQIIPYILSPANPDPQWVNTAYYHSDGNGNITALVQPSGFPVAMYQYDPYGNILAIGGLLANENKYRFSSKEWNDNAGLYYFGYRFYSPNLQRWVNRDPIQEWGGINLYAFVDNDPIYLFDPNGNCSLAAAAPFVLAGEADAGPPGWLAIPATVAALGVAAGLTLQPHPFPNPLYYPQDLSYQNAPPTGLIEPLQKSNYRPNVAPTDAPPKTKPINRDPRTRDKVHEIKNGLKGDGVGPNSWVGVSPDGKVIVTNPDGTAADLGPYTGYCH